MADYGAHNGAKEDPTKMDAARADYLVQVFPIIEWGAVGRSYATSAPVGLTAPVTGQLWPRGNRD